MPTVQPQPQHVRFRDAVVAFLREHAGDLPADEMLALAAHLVGQLTAMQDQRKYTAEQVMEIVARNVQLGNADACARLEGSAEGEA